MPPSHQSNPSGGVEHPAPPPSRLVPLDALRAVAVLLVIGRHIPIPSSLPADSALGLFAAAWARGGWIGVDLFFVLSGFLISGLLFREHCQHGRISVGRFLIRRGLKIYPAFYFFLAATIGLRLYWGWRVNGSQVFAEVFFVQSYVRGVWNHTWSLAVEEHFYLLLPVLLLLMLRRARRGDDPFAALPTICGVLAIGILGLRIVNALTHGYRHDTHLFPTHLRIDSLLFGVLLSYWYHYRKTEVRTIALRHRGLFAVLGVGLLASPFLVPLEKSMAIYTVGFSGLALGSGLLLMAALHAPAAIHGVLAPLAKVGAYSYSIYLWHMPVLGWLLPRIEQGLIGHRLSYVPRAALGVSLCLLLGAGISQLIEYRVLRLRDRLFPSRSQALSGAGADFASSELGPAQATSEAILPASDPATSRPKSVNA